MATKYFMNGGVNSNWSADTNWSTTASTGPNNTTHATSADAVIMNATSPACTVDTASACSTFDGSSYNHILTMNGTLTISTSLNFGLGMAAVGSSSLRTGSTSFSLTTPVLVCPFTLPSTCTLTLNQNTTFSSFIISGGTTTMSGAFNMSVNTALTLGANTTFKIVSGQTVTIGSSGTVDFSAATSAGGITIRSVTASSTAYFTVPSTATLSPVGLFNYMTVTDIDSSGGKTLFTLPGTLTRTVNWNANPGTPDTVAGGFAG